MLRNESKIGLYPETKSELTARLDKAEAEAREYLDLLQRVQADFTNYKRRVEEERVEQSRIASAHLIQKLLPVIDDFGCAFKAVPEEQAKADWVRGLVLIEKKLLSVLEKEGLTRIQAEGKGFDPREHEAVMVEKSKDVEEGRIIDVLQEGYRLNHKLLRPARVKVSKGSGAERVRRSVRGGD